MSSPKGLRKIRFILTEPSVQRSRLTISVGLNLRRYWASIKNRHRSIDNRSIVKLLCEKKKQTHFLTYYYAYPGLTRCDHKVLQLCKNKNSPPSKVVSRAALHESIKFGFILENRVVSGCM